MGEVSRQRHISMHGERIVRLCFGYRLRRQHADDSSGKARKNHFAEKGNQSVQLQSSIVNKFDGRRREASIRNRKLA